MTFEFTLWSHRKKLLDCVHMIPLYRNEALSDTRRPTPPNSEVKAVFLILRAYTSSKLRDVVCNAFCGLSKCELRELLIQSTLLGLIIGPGSTGHLLLLVQARFDNHK